MVTERAGLAWLLIGEEQNFRLLLSAHVSCLDGWRGYSTST